MRLAEVRSMANGVLFSSRKAYQHHEKRLDPNNVNHTCSRSSSLYLSFHQSRTQRHEILFPPAYQSTSYPNLLRDSAQERHMVREGATVRGIPRKHVVLVSISFPTYSLFLSSTKLELYIIALDPLARTHRHAFRFLSNRTHAFVGSPAGIRRSGNSGAYPHI